MNLQDMQLLLAKCRYPGYEFAIHSQDGIALYLQAKFYATCALNGQRHQLQHTRKWQLSQHMTRSELVQTAFKCVLTAIEHEAREQFTYRTQAIFGPHFDVDKLHWLSLSEHSDKRS